MSCCTTTPKSNFFLKTTVKENKTQNAVEAFLSYKIERIENVRTKNKKDNTKS